MNSTSKPYKGRISDWRKVACDQWGYPTEAFGATGYYYIHGLSKGHPQFDGRVFHTSRVVKHEGNDIETMFSRYLLVGPSKNTEATQVAK